MKSDEDFVSVLKDSDKYVGLVEAWLQSKGADLERDPLEIRPDFESRASYRDNGDLRIKQRVEVKHRPDILFTCAEDYPYDSVIVNSANLIDGIDSIRRWAHVIVSGNGTHACIILERTRYLWFKQDKFDSKDQETTSFYFCPVEHCKFVSLGIGDHLSTEGKS